MAYFLWGSSAQAREGLEGWRSQTAPWSGAEGGGPERSGALESPAPAPNAMARESSFRAGDTPKQSFVDLNLAFFQRQTLKLRQVL